MGNGEIKYFLAVSIAALFIIISLLPFVFVDAHAMECYQSSDYYYQMILDCTDTIDVKKSTMDYVYGDINRFSKSFEDAKVYNIRTEGSNTFATLEIPLPVVSDLKSDVKFSKSPNYLMEFLTGKLAGSKLYISLSVIDGYDGTKNAGSMVKFNFQVKEIPCYMWGLQCGSASHFEYALDRGLYLLEPLAKEIQIELEQISSQNVPKEATQKSTPPDEQKIKSTQTTETKPKIETELRGPPIVDSDGDGISDRFDNCKFDKETYNGYLDLDGCPDTIPQAPKPQPTIKDFDKDGIPDEKDMCKYKAEVYNGYIDWDGCPDTAEGQIVVILDDDNDGVLNHLDQCPNMKEVYNGFRDNDGCPDAILGDPDYYKYIETPVKEPQKLPSWLKTNAKWWSVGSISDKDFLEGVKYMIKEDIVKISDVTPKSKSSFSVGEVPYWIKKNAGWWADGLIGEDEFVRNIQYLISNRIIEVY